MFAGRVSNQTTHFAISAVVLLLLLPDSVCAQVATDVVIVRRPENHREFRYSGRILDYSGGSLRLRLKTSGRIRRFETADIQGIQTPRSEPHVQAEQFAALRQYQPALESYAGAIDAETRDWVRRDIYAALTRLHLREGQRMKAAEAFISLTNSDPKTHFRGLAPLWWSTDEQITPVMEAQAKLWTKSPNYFAQLIGASVLFNIPAERSAAMKLMDAIAGNGRGFIHLARAQLWRARLVDGKPVNNAEIRLWRGRLGSMLPEERGGPWFVIGKANAQRLENEEAAIAFLWVPLVHKQDHLLAAEASYYAALSLQKNGSLAEATNLYRETAQRYPGTEFAKKSQQVLKLPGK